MNEKYTSLGCSFRELLLCCDPLEVSMKAALIDYESKNFGNEDEAISFLLGQSGAYRRAIDEIVSTPSCDHRPLGFVLRCVTDDEFADRDWINIGLYNWNFVGLPPKGSDWKEYEKDEHNETFSASFSDWKEHPDREVLLDNGTFQFCHTLTDIAAEIMWEITWGGFSGVETEHRSEEVLGAANAMMEAYKKEHPSA